MRAQAYRSSSGVDTALPVDIQLAAELALLDVFFDIDSHTTVCLHYFEGASQTSGGFTWIIQAIRSGIIPAILRAACRDTEEIGH